MAAAMPTTAPTSITTTPTASATPSPFGSTFFFIIGAVAGTILILLLLIILSICVIVSLRRRRKGRYLSSNDDDLKNNYSYGSTPVLTDDSRLENGGVQHARSNTYDYREDHPMGPLYDTINDKRLGNGASAQAVPNPVYGGEVVHSGSKTAANPVYAEAGQEARGILLSQASNMTDVSGLNPVYSGIAAEPLSPGSSLTSQPQTPSLVPQPSPGGAGAKKGGRYEMQPPSPYAVPDQHDDRYASGPAVAVPAPYAEPQVSPTLGGSGSGAIRYTNAPPQVVPTNPETGYSTLAREDSTIQPPPGPVPVYETIKVKDTRPPVRPDGDGVTLQTNNSYGLLLSESKSPTVTSRNPPAPGSPTSGSGSLPPHSPPPQEPPPPAPSPRDSESQTS